MSASNKGPGIDSRLQNLTNALYVDSSNDIVMRTGFAGNIVISGNVNVPGVIQVDSTPDRPVHVHLTELGTFGNLTTYVPVQGTVTVTGNANVVVVGNISGITTLPAITGNVAVNNFPGNVSITSMPAITGNVNTTITDVITVVVNEDAGDLYAFNNHAAAANRGWTVDNTMRPVVSFQNGSASAADIIKIVEYEIGNNNANQSTIVYEWYEGPLTISGAAIPAWTTFGQHSQYRVYQDQYSSNQGNTFTVPNGNGTYLRHSGIIIGKNTSGDEGPANLRGGGTPNMLTLCMRRVDNATKLDVWFAFTVKELT